MSSLADLQGRVRRALASDDVTDLGGVLVGGQDALRRLAIHQRHYETSLASALMEKFPATAWLIGSDRMTPAARAFARQRPPSRPCIAEYGADFPLFLAAHETNDPPYLRQFAELEWHVGQASIATSDAPLSWSDIVQFGASALPCATVRMQPGLHCTAASWAIDELLQIYLTDSAPEQFPLSRGDIWIQVRGARGDVQLSRLEHAAFIFRAALLDGSTLESAAEPALQRDGRFDAGHALAALVADGLVTGVSVNAAGAA